MHHSLDQLNLSAASNFHALRINPYPGRGIIVGLNEEGNNIVVVYFITGRSENSRNRVLSSERARLFTEPADPSILVDDSSPIFYNAMCEANDINYKVTVVSSSDQTDDVARGYSQHQGLYQTLRAFCYEPDTPNFTPRITAATYWSAHKPIVRMALLRKSPWSIECDRHFYRIDGMGVGFGYCLTTYSGNGNPLPSFTGEPYLLPIKGKRACDVAETFWGLLNAENKVALAVRFIPRNAAQDTSTCIKNKYEKVY